MEQPKKENRKVVVKKGNKKISSTQTNNPSGIFNSATVFEKVPFNASGVVDNKRISGDSILSLNKNRVRIESIAKNDSTSAANAAKAKGMNVYNQRAKGNEAANKTRKAGNVGNISVTRYKNPHEYQSYEKNTGEHDRYFRTNNLEADMRADKKK